MRVGITGSDSTFTERVEGMLEAPMVLVPCDREGIDGGGRPLDALIIGEGMPLDDALETTQQLEEKSPTTSVVIVAKQNPQTLRAALLAGARDVWSADMADEEMKTSLHRVIDSTQRRLAAEAVAARSPSTNQVIVVLSPKGGSGKTTIATNLAMGLARETSKSVAIVDLDMRFGDVATALNIIPEHDIADAMGKLRNITALKALMGVHSSGVYALCAPEDPAVADEVEPASISDLIATLTSQIDTIVVDTAAGLDEYTLAALDHATDIVVVSTTDIFAVNGARKLLQVLELIDFGEPDRHFVLNRANARVDIDRNEIERSLGWTVDVEIPSTRAVPLAVNRGQSLFDAGKVARRPMQQLLSRFIEEPAHAAGSRS